MLLEPHRKILQALKKTIPAIVLQGFEVDYDFAQELGKCFD
jgi:ABC-type Fe3+-citrate transport system substrate-binding protein